MNRVFDLIAVAGIAIVVLLPKASVEARPALAADSFESSRVASLEDAFARAPTSEPAAIELAELYLRLEHPDWALVTLSQFAGKDASARLSLLRATAHAERLEAGLAVAAVKEGQSVCESRGCPPQVGARLTVIGGPMQALVDQGIDPYKDPARAKEAVGKVLHSTHTATPDKK